MTSTTTDTSRAREAVGVPAGGSTKTSDKDKVIAVRTQQMDRMMPQLARAMPRGVEADQLARDVLTALRTNDDLWKCTEASLWGGAMTAAQVGLRVGVLGHGWLIPFNNRWLARQRGESDLWEAQWVLGYQGMLDLIDRSGKVLNIVAHTIFANDQYRILLGAEERIDHEPVLFGEQGNPVIYYSQAWLTNGGYGFQYETHERMLEHAQNQRSWANKGGPWHKHFEPMAWKTCLRRQFRWLPKTAALALALEADDQVANYKDGQVTRTGDQDAADAPPAATPEPEREHITAVSVPQPDASSTAEAGEQPPASRGRRRQPDSKARQALLTALRDRYGTDAEVAKVLLRRVLHGEAVTFDYITSDELRAALQLPPEEPEPGPVDADLFREADKAYDAAQADRAAGDSGAEQ